MRTVAFEGRAFVLSANQCMKRKDLPEWITGKPASTQSETAVNGEFRAQGSGRRRSTVTKTEDNHEITWPLLSGKEAGASITDSDSAIADEESHKLSKGKTDYKAFPVADKKSQSSVEEEFVSRGGSCIIDPMGQVLAGPLWEVEDGGLLLVDADFEDCERGRLDLDVAGSYSRNDAFKLSVEGLDITPPP